MNATPLNIRRPQPGCSVCAHPLRRNVEAALASKRRRTRAPSRIARRFAGLTRREVAAHRDLCLTGNPRANFCLEHGLITEAELRERAEKRRRAEKAAS